MQQHLYRLKLIVTPNWLTKPVFGIIAIVLCFGTSSCSSSNSPEPAEKEKLAYQVVNVYWMNQAHGLLATDAFEKAPEAQKGLAGLILYQAALVGSFQYIGFDVDSSYYFRTVKQLYQHELISKSDLKDPFGLNQFFQNHPDEMWPIGSIPNEVVQDRDSYRKYTNWFRQQVGVSAQVQ